MKNQKMIIGGVFTFSAFMTCCLFPFLNLTKEKPIQMETISWLIIFISVIGYHSIGKSQAKLFSNKSIIFVLLFNLAATILGFVSRFLLEFGEVSNTYNFTIPNILLHTLVAVTISSTICLLEKSTSKN